MVVCQNESLVVDYDTAAVGIRDGARPGQIGLLCITFRFTPLDKDASDRRLGFLDGVLECFLDNQGIAQPGFFITASRTS